MTLEWLSAEIGGIYSSGALLTTAHLPNRHDADAKVIRGAFWPVYWAARAVRHFRPAKEGE